LKEEALLAARLLQGAEIELLSTRFLFDAATRISIEIDHPAYDCLYLFQQTDTLCRSRIGRRQHTLHGRAILLVEAVKL
jgi:hypothetical protein